MKKVTRYLCDSCHREYYCKERAENCNKWDLYRKGVHKFCTELCKCYSEWGAGGCNRSDGEPLCYYGDNTGGYGRGLNNDGKLPSWCPFKKRGCK